MSWLYLTFIFCINYCNVGTTCLDDGLNTLTVGVLEVLRFIGDFGSKEEFILGPHARDVFS